MEPSARPAAPPDTTAGATSPDGVPGEPSWGAAPTAEYRRSAAPGLVPPPAFPQATGPTADELNDSVQFLQEQTESYRADRRDNPRQAALADFCQVLLGLNEFIYVD